jgi:hypothetical protein
LAVRPSDDGATLGRWEAWLALAAFCLITGIVAARTYERLEVPGHPELPSYGMQDFRDSIYYPVRTLLEGDNPYSPSAVRRHYAPGSIFPLYTPMHFALHLPYGFLSQRTAELVHFGLTTVLTVILAFVCLRLCDLPATVATVFGLATFLVGTRAGYLHLYFGQVTAYLVLATYGALRFGRTRPELAALCFALTCIKPTFGVPLGVLLLASGAGRAAVLGGTLALVASLIPGAFVLRAAGGIAPFVASLRENVAGWSGLQESSGATGIYSVDTIAFVDRLYEIPPTLEVLLSLAILGLGTAAVTRAMRTAPRAPLLAESVACLTMLTFTHHQFYDILLLALPATALASGRLPLAAGPAGRWWRWGLVALLAIGAFNHLSSYEVLDGFGIVGPARLAVVSATGAAITITFLVLVALALRPGARPAN